MEVPSSVRYNYSEVCPCDGTMGEGFCRPKVNRVLWEVLGSWGYAFKGLWYTSLPLPPFSGHEVSHSVTTNSLSNVTNTRVQSHEVPHWWPETQDYDEQNKSFKNKLTNLCNIYLNCASLNKNPWVRNWDKNLIIPRNSRGTIGWPYSPCFSDPKASEILLSPHFFLRIPLYQTSSVFQPLYG